MDTENSRLIVNEINKIMNKNYNILSFDLLHSEQLLQVLLSVLSYVDGSEPINIQQGSLEDAILRILETLRILKYKINDNSTPSAFRQGLVQGDKKVIHPILLWLITNLNDLKKRSYLAQFLVKIDIPKEFLADPDILYLYEQYEALMEEFKAIHKESEILKESSISVAELKSDIKAMEVERESALKKIENVKRKVESLPEKDKLLEMASALRIEKERRKEMMENEVAQQNLLASNEQKLQRLSMQLQELRQNAGRASPTELVRRMEEEYTVNTYLVQQKIPQEIRARQEDIKMYEMVLNETSLTRAHLDDINFKIQQVSEEVNELMQSQISDQSPGEDKNAPFRQQAAIIARKKEAKAEQLSDIRNQLAQVEEELDSKQKQLSDVAGETVLRGEDLKKYVSKLRVKGAQYKKQKAQLAALKTEAGILTRTLEILSSKDPSITKVLAEAEQTGMREFEETGMPSKSVSVDTTPINRERTSGEISDHVTQLKHELVAKKRELEPLVSELSLLREKYAEADDHFQQLKKVYDSTASGLENNTGRLKEEVDKLQAEHDATEEEMARLQKEIDKAEEDAMRVEEEVKLYVSGTAEAKKNSLREQLQQKIAQQEKVGKQLKEEQEALKDIQAKNEQQVRYWKDLERLFKCKLECLEDEKKKAGIVRKEQGAETLILPQ